MKKTLLSAAIAITLSTSAFATSINSGLEDQTEVSITIYNSGLGLVKDTRQLTNELVEGKDISSVSFQGVSASIIPETSLLNGARVKEQNYSYDLLSHESMLKAMLGQRITVYLPEPGNNVNATLLSINGNQIMLQTDHGEILSLPKQSNDIQYGFTEVPENLSALPTLTMELYPDQNPDDSWQLTYLTNGMGWKADYVIELNDSQNMDVSSWVTLQNNTSVNYKNAQVNLLAGDVNRAQRHAPQTMMMKSASYESASMDLMEASDVGDYKLYRLPFKTDVMNKQQKQVKMFDITGAKYKKTYTYTAGKAHYGQTQTTKYKAQVSVEFMNTEEYGLGLPMPKGVVRFYERDDKGQLQFAGEDNVNHTDKGEKLSLSLGEAFGVTIEERISHEERKYRDQLERETTLTITNSKQEPVLLQIAQPLQSNMRVLESNTKHKKVPGRGQVFSVTVPAESTQEIDYTILYQS